MIFIYSISETRFRKIGITSRPPKVRLKEIQGTYSKARIKVALPTPLTAGLIETILHTVFFLFQKTRKGSGKTEWFALFPLGFLADLLVWVLTIASWFGVLWLVLNGGRFLNEIYTA
jgi:hypothetical protein